MRIEGQQIMFVVQSPRKSNRVSKEINGEQEKDLIMKGKRKSKR